MASRTSRVTRNARLLLSLRCDNTLVGKGAHTRMTSDLSSSPSGASIMTRRAPLHVKVVTLSFTMTFLAEWGDRSQIATIALAAAKDPYGVTLGGVLGHSLCTGMAVIGGRMLATR